MGKQKDEIIYNVGCPDWMMTFGDCMSLLLTFFVLLLSFSSPDKNKLLDMLGGIQGALGIVPLAIEPLYGETNPYKEDKNEESRAGGSLEDGAKETISIDLQDSSPTRLRSLKVINRFNQFKERLAETGFSNLVSIKQADQGIMLQINTDVLFKKDSETFSQDALKLIQEFSSLASSLNNEIRLIVCFKPADKGDRFLTEWAMARKRSFALGDLVSSKYKIPAYRFSYGTRIIEDDRPGYIELIIAEKVGTSQVTLSEFMNLNKKM
ncbi:MAG: hypothetical protein A2X49_05070 [Lentisphaerae bacterium GWF2_52_8]|nr:MAG: hypothetical protein A2X49_05070 [Lentisphaerae bacterium GWF2_52_8]